MTVLPVSVDRLTLGIAVGAVHQDNPAIEAVRREQLRQIGLRSYTLGEDDCLALPSLGDDLVHGLGKALYQFLALGIRPNGPSQLQIALQFLDFCRQPCSINLWLLIRTILFVEFLGQLIDTVDIVRNGFIDRLLGLKTGDQLLQIAGHRKCRRAQYFADLQNDKLIGPVAVRNRVRAFQKFGNLKIELGFIVPRFEIESDRIPGGIVDVSRLLHLPTQRAVTNR